MKKITSPKELVKYLISQGVAKNQKELGPKLGYNNPQAFSHIITGVSKMPDNFIEKVKELLPSLDEELLSFCDETQITTDSTPTVKLLPQLARGGSLSDFSKGVMDYDCEIITSPVRGAEFAIQITGDSMAPEYPSGSRVLIQKVNERAFIEWGKVYVLDTVNGVVVKEVRKTDDPDVVQCCSINPDPKYQSYTIETKYITGWYRILMMMSLK